MAGIQWPDRDQPEDSLHAVQGNEDLQLATMLAGAGSPSSVDANAADLQLLLVLRNTEAGQAASERSQPWTTPLDLLVEICSLSSPS